MSSLHERRPSQISLIRQASKYMLQPTHGHLLAGRRQGRDAGNQVRMQAEQASRALKVPMKWGGQTHLPYGKKYLAQTAMRTKLMTTPGKASSRMVGQFLRRRCGCWEMPAVKPMAGRKISSNR